jgi:hypothetical protein
MTFTLPGASVNPTVWRFEKWINSCGGRSPRGANVDGPVCVLDCVAPQETTCTSGGVGLDLERAASAPAAGTCGPDPSRSS